MRRSANTYVAYSNDKYSLPVCIAFSVVELARFLECTCQHLRLCLRLGLLCKGYEVKSYVIVD